MAKLSAHGYEVARVRITVVVPDAQVITELSYRSDGYILRKTTRDEGPLGGRYGGEWKVSTRFTDRKITPERIMRAARECAWQNNCTDEREARLV
jgi:hypothetical protein